MSGAPKVASGILLSRLAGFVRDASLAYYFGAGPHADVFRTVLRGPNILQNLLGEQTLSASFIPVYTRLLEEDRAAAGRFAGAIFGLLLAVVTVLVALGVTFAGPITALLAPGFLADADRVASGVAETDRYLLAVKALRWIFPMTGVLVLSAWSLGVLNSHRRLFLPYVAPVAWNASIIAALFWAGSSLASEGTSGLDRLLLAACVGALVGGVLQFLVQLPLVLRVLRGFRLSVSTRIRGVREALRAFTPLLAARGVVQVSGYLDMLLASLLAVGAIGALGWAYTLYILPVSLFAMSIAAAELPELSRETESEARFALRVKAALSRVGALVVPTTVGYIAFGYLIVGAIYRRGSFGQADNSLVYVILAAYALGLPATTASRVLNNAFYAMGETRRPARVAVFRVVVSVLTGAALMLWLDTFPLELLPWPVEQSALRMGAAGLAMGSALGAWLELVLLQGGLGRIRPGLDTGLGGGSLNRYFLLAFVMLLPAAAVWKLSPNLPLLVQATLVVGCYAAGYLGLAKRLGWIDFSELLSGPRDLQGEDETGDQ